MYSRAIKAYSKSVVLGGGRVLHPLPNKETAEEFAEVLRVFVKEAEKAAYQRGREDSKKEIRKALGFPGV